MSWQRKPEMAKTDQNITKTTEKKRASSTMRTNININNNNNNDLSHYILLN